MSLPSDTRDFRLQAHIPNHVGFLLLHTYLKGSNSGSFDSIEDVIALNAEAGSFKANDLKIPLHFARDLCHIRALLKIHPDGVLSRDHSGRTPLHTFLSDIDAYSRARRGACGTEGDLVEICSLLSQRPGGSYSEVLTARDKEGMTPLTLAICSPNPSLRGALLRLFSLCRRSALISVQNASTRELVRLQGACHGQSSSSSIADPTGKVYMRSPQDVVIAMQTPEIGGDVEEGGGGDFSQAFFGITVVELMMQHSQQRPPSYYDDVLAAIVSTYPVLSQIKTFKCGEGRSRGEQLFYPFYIAIQSQCSAAVARLLLLHLPYRSAREKCQQTRLTAAHICVLSNNSSVLSVILKEDPLLSLLYSMKVAAVKHRAFSCLRLLLRCHIMVVKMKASKLLSDIEAKKAQQQQEGEAGDPHSDILSLPDDVLLAIDEDDSKEYLHNKHVNNDAAARDFSVVSNVTNIATYQRQIEDDAREEWRGINRFQSLLFSAVIYKTPADALSLLLELYVECNVYQHDLSKKVASPDNLTIVAAPPLHAIFQVHGSDVETVEGLVYVLTKYLPSAAAVVDYYGDSALHIAVQRYPLRQRLLQYLLLACPDIGVKTDLKGKLAIEYFPGLFDSKKPSDTQEGLVGVDTFLTGGRGEELEEQQLPLAALLLYCLPVSASGRGKHSPLQHKFVWTHVLADCDDKYSDSVKIIMQSFPEPRLLAFCEDSKGHCYAIDIATPACKRHLLASLYFMGTYSFKALALAGQPGLRPTAARRQALVADVPMAQHLLRFADRYDDEGGLSKQCSLAALLLYRSVDSYLFDRRTASRLISSAPNPAQTAAAGSSSNGDIHQRVLDLLRRKGRLLGSHSAADDPRFYSECRKSKYGVDAEAYLYCNVFVFESTSAAEDFHAAVSSLESKHQYYVQNNLYHKDPSSPPARSPSKQALLSPSSSAGRLQASRPSSAASRPSSAARRAAVSRPSSAQERPPAAACSSGGPPAAVSRGAKLAVLGPSPGLPAIAPPSRRPGNPSRGRVEAKGKPSPKVAPKIGSSSDGVTDEALAIIGANTNLDP